MTGPDDVVELTAALATIDSVNPSLVPGAAGEQDVADFVAAWARDRGFEVHVSEAAPGRPNVVAVRRGSGGGRSLLFNAHLDTVGASGAETMAVRVAGDRVVGRGVLDTKGGLAAALVAAASFAESELAGDLIVAAVADEEYASLGTDALVAGWTADAAVVLEPTDLMICPSHRGFAVIEAEFGGRAAHTSRPDRGVNAIHAAARAIHAVVELEASWAGTGAAITDRPSVLVSRIESGSETFTVPPRCDIVVELRTTATDPEGQERAVHAAIDGSREGEATISTRTLFGRPPLGTPADHALVEAAAAALGESGAVVIGGAPFWTDAALHAAAWTPAIVFGPAGEGLHEDHEWVTIVSLRRCESTLRSLARRWCGPT